MSDESDHKEHPYTDQQLSEALDYVGKTTPNAECPFCKTSKWSFEGRGGLLFPVPNLGYIPLTTVAFFGPAPAIPTITLTCTNCGFVRHHNVSMIMTKIGRAGKND